MNKLFVPDVDKAAFEPGNMLRFGQQNIVYMVTFVYTDGNIDLVDLGSGKHYPNQDITPNNVSRVLEVTIKA